MKSGHKIAAALVAAAAVAASGAGVAFSVFDQAEEAAAARKHSYVLIDRGNGLLASLREAETAERGFALTGKDMFLQTYLAAGPHIQRDLADLRTATWNAVESRHLDAIGPAVTAKLAHMAEVVALRRGNDTAAVAALVSTGDGKRLMDAICAEIQAYIQLEQRLLAQADDTFQAKMRELFLIVVGSSFLLLLLALLFAFLVSRELQQRLKNAAHAETAKLLDMQRTLNLALQETNHNLLIIQAKLSVTLRSIGDAVLVTDEAGAVTLLNPAAEALTGWTEAEAVGRPVAEVFEIINQETREPSTIPVLATLEHGTIQGLANHTVLIAKDGRESAIADSCAPIRGPAHEVVGAVLVFRDVTHEYAVQQRVRDSSAMLQAILNTVADGVVTVRASNGHIEKVNPSIQRMFGYAPAELVGAEFNTVIPALRRAPDELPPTDGPPGELAPTEGREVDGLRKDGTTFPLELRVTTMELGGASYFTAVVRDSTARMAIENERSKLDSALKLQNVELEVARAAAEKANLAKSDFLSSMSHELRTPLNAILGFAQLLQTDVPPPSKAQLSSIEPILQAGWHLLKLINEILDLAKVESGQMPLSEEPVLLAEVMAECRGMVEASARQRGITLVFPDFAQPCFVRADRIRVKQVLINLLSNAIKYNVKQGSVEVTARLVDVRRIRVSIADTGLGLDATQIGQLFQPFNRLGQEGDGEEGTGIGLVVAKRLVELMGGTIGVESAVGKGSVFWFELIAVSAPQFVAETVDLQGLSLPRTAARSRIHTLLSVEDNPANLKLIERVMARRSDIRLLTAVDGNSGIDIARAAQPDVILMDINLPGINGLEALKILRADPATSRIPVIAVSANAIPSDIEKGLKAGFFRYVTKPIKVTELMEALEEALEHVAKLTGR